MSKTITYPAWVLVINETSILVDLLNLPTELIHEPILVNVEKYHTVKAGDIIQINMNYTNRNKKEEITYERSTERKNCNHTRN